MNTIKDLIMYCKLLKYMRTEKRLHPKEGMVLVYEEEYKNAVKGLFRPFRMQAMFFDLYFYVVDTTLYGNHIVIFESDIKKIKL